MSDAFREPSSGEIQAALIQFMGQNLGEIKKLDSHIVEGNSTLRGMTLQPEAVLRSIPASPQPQVQAPPPQPLIHIAPPVPEQQVMVEQVNSEAETDPNQLIFDFIDDLKNTPSLKDTILNIEKKIALISEVNLNLYKLDKKIDHLIELVESKTLKKKTVQNH